MAVEGSGGIGQNPVEIASHAFQLSRGRVYDLNHQRFSRFQRISQLLSVDGPPYHVQEATLSFVDNEGKPRKLPAVLTRFSEELGSNVWDTVTTHITDKKGRGRLLSAGGRETDKVYQLGELPYVVKEYPFSKYISGGDNYGGRDVTFNPLRRLKQHIKVGEILAKQFPDGNVRVAKQYGVVLDDENKKFYVIEELLDSRRLLSTLLHSGQVPQGVDRLIGRARNAIEHTASRRAEFVFGNSDIFVLDNQEGNDGKPHVTVVFTDVAPLL